MELSLSENKMFLIIDSCTELEYEQLKISLTKKIDGWRFHPLVKKKNLGWFNFFYEKKFK
jgi:hypothetical protein